MHDTTNILRKADAEAEGLLGIVRMLVAAALAIALTLAARSPGRPQIEALDLQLIVAATVIASYFLVGVASYVIVRCGWYRMWMAWVTAILDVVLICGNVWLSVGNVGLNSRFALLFPSALMIPAILTFGALRFRPAIQIAMTVVTGILVVLIIFSNPATQISNVQLAEYVRITYGIPPNLIRVVLLLATGAIVAVAAWRARRLLDQIASEIRQRVNLTRFLPRGVADDTSDAAMQRLRTGRHATLAIMFIDIRDFTQLTENLGAAAASRLLTDFRSNVLDIVEARDGVVDKFIGDGALILFGIDQTADAAAGNATGAAIALLGRIERWNANRAARGKQTFAIGVGIHLGEVVVGAIGDDRRLEFTVIGDEVNVASRIEQATKSAGFKLLASDAIIERIGTASTERWQQLGKTAVRGRSAPLGLWGYPKPGR